MTASSAISGSGNVKSELQAADAASFRRCFATETSGDSKILPLLTENAISSEFCTRRTLACADDTETISEAVGDIPEPIGC
jgi:hypothetical protein